MTDEDRRPSSVVRSHEVANEILRGGEVSIADVRRWYGIGYDAARWTLITIEGIYVCIESTFEGGSKVWRKNMERSMWGRHQLPAINSRIDESDEGGGR